MPMKGTIFKGILLILFLGVGETAVYSQQQQRKDTLVVTRDRTGDYRNIQEAVEAVRAFMDYTVTIYIKNGTYKEKLVIPSWVKNVQLVGESAENTIITYDDHANINKMGTFRTYTVKVSGNDITFKDLTIENNAAPLGQAVALHTEGDRLMFINCRFLGNQDTIYTGSEGARLLFTNCYIEGTTDFIFGPSTALFEYCELNFVRILGICKDFAGNRVNELGNIPRCGVVPKFSDLEVIALGITAEAFGFDSENLLFHRLHNECKADLPNLISRRQFNARHKLPARLAEEIRKNVAVAIDGSEDVFCIDSKPVKVCQNARAKRCTMGRDNREAAPDWGYCASQGIHYYGYKLHAVCGIHGVIHSYDMTAASIHDLHYLKNFNSTVLPKIHPTSPRSNRRR